MKTLIIILIFFPLIGFNQDIKETSSMSKKELKKELKYLNNELDSLRSKHYNEDVTVFDKKFNSEKLRSKESLIIEINRVNVIIDDYYQYIKLKEQEKRELQIVLDNLRNKLDSLILIHDFSRNFTRSNSNDKEYFEDQIRYISDSVSRNLDEFKESLGKRRFVVKSYESLLENVGLYDYQNHKLRDGPPQKVRDYTLYSDKDIDSLFVVNAHVFQKLNHINNQNSDTIVYNGYIINGLFQGPWKEYYENGNVHRIRYYINGVQTILFRFYENGKLERIKNYTNDLIGGIYKREWNPDGYFIVETEVMEARTSHEDANFRFYD